MRGEEVLFESARREFLLEGEGEVLLERKKLIKKFLEIWEEVVKWERICLKNLKLERQRTKFVYSLTPFENASVCECPSIEKRKDRVSLFFGEGSAMRIWLAS